MEQVRASRLDLGVAQPALYRRAIQVDGMARDEEIRREEMKEGQGTPCDAARIVREGQRADEPPASDRLEDPQGARIGVEQQRAAEAGPPLRRPPGQALAE